ncbi:DUF3800 domain-containing protein [Limosilactobacillus fermentum]|uniref:DUF3800 domain-containing protein n=1 Tax=Limosilactobacillus fermentum TaxID=1613 RepID=UPI00242F3297|nr:MULTISPECIES: DUF3800 domain-containing protein [Limosilactobacillus]MDY2640195.1 DUF3800 domain-containing protein [Ligilactobacillus salivarius]WJD84469.1 DUF3800 domain-containing protein [Limosilactobacillus fermentum]
MFNVYCDESGHLEHDEVNVMVIGGIAIDNEFRKKAYSDIKQIKIKYGIPIHREIKWTKVSKGELDYYKSLIDYFIENEQLRFRAIIVPDKTRLDHARFNQTQDEFYYKIYYDMLKKVLLNHDVIRVYIDIKDTNSSYKVEKLTKYLNNTYTAHRNDVKIMQIRSHENSLLQMADLLIGCVMYKNRNLTSSSAKLELVKYLESKINSSLNRTSYYSELKFNLLVMDRL